MVGVNGSRFSVDWIAWALIVGVGGDKRILCSNNDLAKARYSFALLEKDLEIEISPTVFQTLSASRVNFDAITSAPPLAAS